MALLAQVARREVVTDPANRMDLRRLAREDLILAGFGSGTIASLLPRGVRLLEAARGEYGLPDD